MDLSVKTLSIPQQRPQKLDSETKPLFFDSKKN